MKATVYFLTSASTTASTNVAIGTCSERDFEGMPKIGEGLLDGADRYLIETIQPDEEHGTVVVWAMKEAND